MVGSETNETSNKGGDTDRKSTLNCQKQDLQNDKSDGLGDKAKYNSLMGLVEHGAKGPKENDEGPTDAPQRVSIHTQVIGLTSGRHKKDHVNHPLALPTSDLPGKNETSQVDIHSPRSCVTEQKVTNKK